MSAEQSTQTEGENKNRLNQNKTICLSHGVPLLPSPLPQQNHSWVDMQEDIPVPTGDVFPHMNTPPCAAGAFPYSPKQSQAGLQSCHEGMSQLRPFPPSQAQPSCKTSVPTTHSLTQAQGALPQHQEMQFPPKGCLSLGEGHGFMVTQRLMLLALKLKDLTRFKV